MMYRLFAIAVLMFAVSAISLAEDKPATGSNTGPATTAPATQPAKPVNTKCPVSGDAVDAKVKTVVYKGKTIGFCCDDCVEPFNKNPEKYAKNIK